MNNIRLFLENQEIELSEQSIIAITRQFEEITNPTIICNDWSKTIQIPFTTKNNRIFGLLYNPDRLTQENDLSQIGMYFDPYRKIEFRLEYQDSVIMTGYAKNIYSTQTNGVGYYSITLNGELGKVFQEMKRITFEPAEEETKYLLDSSPYYLEQIDASLIYDCWQNTANNSTLLKKKTDTDYSRNSIIGFTPNLAYNDDFDYNTYQLTDYKSETLTDVLNSIKFADKTGIEPDTATGGKISPRGMGEFRSYLQTPYIYFNQFFQLFLEKSKELTGYQFNLSEDWFNYTNPYWSKLVMGMKPFDVNKVEKDIKHITVLDASSDSLYTVTRQGESDYYYTPRMDTKQSVYLNFSDSDYSSGMFIHQKAFQTIYMDVPVSYKIYRTGEDITILDLWASREFYFGVDVREKGKSDVITSDRLIVFSTQSTTHSEDDYNNVKWQTEGKYVSGKGIENTYTFTAHIQVTPVDYDRDINLSVFMQASASGAEQYGYMFVKPNGNLRYPFDIKGAFTITEPIQLWDSDVIRSNSYFTINDLWDNNYNPFDIFLNYCKLYRLVFDIDYINKSISIEPTTSYFSNYTIKDWTNKLDMTNTFELKPISFENKYVMFNYSDNDVQLGKDYNEYFGVNYGDIKLITDYNFNTNTQTLMEGLQPTIVYTPNVLSWTTLYDKIKIAYTFGKEIFLNNLDKDEKVVNTFGQFFFVKNAAWDKSGDLRNVKITDDTHLQVVTQTFFYSQDAGISLSPTLYKQPTLFYDDKCCLVNIPSKNYTYDKSYMTGKKSIYDLIWLNYIKERYDKNNKIITCYLKLSQYDFANFKFSDFIKINNQIYIINKIYDYNPATTYTTKVELITIQDLNGYTTNNL